MALEIPVPIPLDLDAEQNRCLREHGSFIWLLPIGDILPVGQRISVRQYGDQPIEMVVAMRQRIENRQDAYLVVNRSHRQPS